MAVSDTLFVYTIFQNIIFVKQIGYLKDTLTFKIQIRCNVNERIDETVLTIIPNLSVSTQQNDSFVIWHKFSSVPTQKNEINY
jgi:hypothetical protein